MNWLVTQYIFNEGIDQNSSTITVQGGNTQNQTEGGND